MHVGAQSTSRRRQGGGQAGPGVTGLAAFSFWERKETGEMLSVQKWGNLSRLAW